MMAFLFHCFFLKRLPSSCYADINCSDQQLFFGLSIVLYQEEKDLHDNVCMPCFALNSRIPPVIMLQSDKDLMNPGEPHEYSVILY